MPWILFSGKYQWFLQMATLAGCFSTFWQASQAAWQAMISAAERLSSYLLMKELTNSLLSLITFFSFFFFKNSVVVFKSSLIFSENSLTLLCFVLSDILLSSFLLDLGGLILTFSNSQLNIRSGQVRS